MAISRSSLNDLDFILRTILGIWLLFNILFNYLSAVFVYAGDSNIELFEYTLDPPDIEELDPETGNPCVIIPPNVGVEKGVYTFLRSLPVIDESYYLVYQRCCRNR